MRQSVSVVQSLCLDSGRADRPGEIQAGFFFPLTCYTFATTINDAAHYSLGRGGLAVINAFAYSNGIFFVTVWGRAQIS